MSVNGRSGVRSSGFVFHSRLLYAFHMTLKIWGRARFPDFIKNLISARDNRNLCMHVKQDVCNIELFIEQMIYISKVGLYFEQHMKSKIGT